LKSKNEIKKNLTRTSTSTINPISEFFGIDKNPYDDSQDAISSQEEAAETLEVFGKLENYLIKKYNQEISNKILRDIEVAYNNN
jgi:hypothetical protein